MTTTTIALDLPTWTGPAWATEHTELVEVVEEGTRMTTPCRLRDHLPLAIAEPKAWVAWKLERAAEGLHHLATRLDNSIVEDPAGWAVAAYLELQALKAPEVITPGPRIRRYMATGRTPAA